MAKNGKIVQLVIALVLVSALIPMGLTMLVNANTTGWGSSELAMWALIPTIAIIAIFLLILKEAGVDIGV